MEPLAKKGSDMLHGRIMATLFYEASTRTRLSFESAITAGRDSARIRRDQGYVRREG